MHNNREGIGEFTGSTSFLFLLVYRISDCLLILSTDWIVFMVQELEIMPGSESLLRTQRDKPSKVHVQIELGLQNNDLVSDGDIQILAFEQELDDFPWKLPPLQ